MQRWRSLCNGLDALLLDEGCLEATSYNALVKAYCEPHRAYHTLAHLEDCLRQLDIAWHLAERPYEVEAALWFHDVVYDTQRSDNEAQSATWAARTLSEIGVSSICSDRVAELILATRHDRIPSTLDAALLVDIDLSILGQPTREFDRYEAQIRQEYVWVEESIFRSARAQILQAFLSRSAIYQTAFFRERYEAPARANLSRSLALLQLG